MNKQPVSTRFKKPVFMLFTTCAAAILLSSCSGRQNAALGDLGERAWDRASTITIIKDQAGDVRALHIFGIPWIRMDEPPPQLRNGFIRKSWSVRRGKKWGAELKID